MKSVEDYALIAFSTITGAVGLFGVWLVRTVFTDNKRLDLLGQKQDMQHKEMMTALAATQAQVGAVGQSNAVAVETQAQIVRLLANMQPVPTPEED